MRKWFMLVCYSMIQYLSGYAFASIATIPEKAQDYYGQSKEVTNLLVQVFWITYLPIAPFAAWLLTKSLHNSLLVIYVSSVIGTWIKFIAGTNFWLALFGQCFISSVSCLLLTAISVLTNMWFPLEEHLLALSLGGLSPFLGMGTSFLIAPQIDISTNNLLQAIVNSSLAAVYILIARKDPNPPTSVPLCSFLKEVGCLFLDKTHIFLVFVIGLVAGLSYSFIGTLGEDLEDEDITSSESGIIGFIFALSGMFGGLFVSCLEKKGVSLKSSLKVFIVFTAIAFCLWCIFAEDLLADFFLGALVGFFYFCLIPSGIRLSIGYNTIVRDTIPSGLIFFFGQASALVFSFPITYSSEAGFHSLWVIFILYMVIGSLLLIIVLKLNSEEVRRSLALSLAEQKEKEKISDIN